MIEEKKLRQQEGEFFVDFGAFQTENNVFLAPLAGVSDLAFRTIAKEMGCGMMYTEMVSAKALSYRDKKTAQIMRLGPGEHPVGIQIFGSDPAVMAEGAALAEAAGADLIDINMGCPVPKVTGNGEGSFLMTKPKLAGEIVRAVAAAVKVPVSVKIRSGWDEESKNAPEFASVLEEAGAAAVCVHGRTKKQMYSGAADWEIIAQVKRRLRIPVIGNGDIRTPEDAARMRGQTGCDAVMLARGVMGNPWLIRQCIEQLETGKVKTTVSFSDRVQMALYHTRLLIQTKGERVGILEARGHLANYVKGMRGAAKAKSALTRVSSLQEAEEIFAALGENFENCGGRP